MTITLHTSKARQAIIKAMKANSELNAITPRIYPSKTPSNVEFPFVRFGTSFTQPVFITGTDGNEVSADIHSFVKASSAFPDPEATTDAMNGLIASIINNMDNIDIGDAEMTVIFERAQTIADSAEADSYHGIVSFTATII